MSSPSPRPEAGGARYLGPYLVWEPGMSEKESKRRRLEAEERLAGAKVPSHTQVEAIHLGGHLIWDPTMTSEEARRARHEALGKLGLLPPPPALPEKTIWDSPSYDPAEEPAPDEARPRLEREAREAVAQVKAAIDAAQARQARQARTTGGTAPAIAPKPQLQPPPSEAATRKREGLPPLHRAPQWVWALILWVLMPGLSMLAVYVFTRLR